MRSHSLLIVLSGLLLTLAANASATQPGTDIVLTRGVQKPGHAGSGEHVHTVAPGETLSGILTAAGLSLPEAEEAIPLVLELNPGLTDPDTIFPGQALVLPPVPGSLPPPSSSSLSSSIPDLRREGELLPLLRRSLDGIGESLSASGTLSLPYGPGKAITIDNSAYPLLEASTGRDLILDIDGRMPEDWKVRIEERWPAYDVIQLPREGDFPDLLQAVLAAGGYHSLARKEELSFGREGEVSLTPDFVVIKTPESLLDGELYVINVLESPRDALPGEILRLAEEHSITVVEVLPVPGPEPGRRGASHEATHRRKKITASDTPTLLTDLLPLLGFSSSAAETYRYPSLEDPAILLEVLPDLLLRREGKTLPIFFDDPAPGILADLAGEDVRPLAFSRGASLAVVLGRLFTAAGIDYSGPAVEFYRPDERFSVSVEGFYLLIDGQPTLLTDAATPPRIASLLANSGISILTCIVR